MMHEPRIPVLGIERSARSCWHPVGPRLATAPGDQPQKIAAEDQGLVLRRQVQGVNLRQLHAGMQPRPVRAEQHLACACSLDRLFQQIEPADPGRIGVDVRVAYQVVDQASWARQSSEKLPRCAMMKATSGYSVANSSTIETSPIGS